ncbi:ScpA family protein, partial [Roseibium sp.]
LNLELAADYLVMAAWLAYLKSRLLLPPDEKEEEEQSPEEMAEALRFQLMRLEAMQQAGQALMSLPQFGADFFARGQGESISVRRRPIYDVTLYELLRAYADHRVRHDRLALRIEATHLYSVEDAVQRLSRVLGAVPEWQTLFSFLPSGLRKGLRLRSAVASTFVASLQLVKDGKAEINQAGTFAPIYFRSREGDA